MCFVNLNMVTLKWVICDQITKTLSPWNVESHVLAAMLCINSAFKATHDSIAKTQSSLVGIIIPRIVLCQLAYLRKLILIGVSEYCMSIKFCYLLPACSNQQH